MAREKRKKTPATARRERAAKIKVLLVLMLAGAAVFFGWWIGGILTPYFSPHFRVEEIQAAFADRTRVNLNLEVYGVKKGQTGLFAVDLRDLSERIEADYPELDRVRVTRVFPDRLQLTLEKRRPLAVLRPEGMGNGHFLLVDRKGVVFSGGEGRAPFSLPVIEGTKIRRDLLVPGKRPESEALAAAILVLGECGQRALAKSHPPEKIVIAGRKDVTLELKDNLTVRLGEEDYRYRLALLESVLAAKKTEEIHDLEIDLRFGDAVVREKK